MISDNKGKVYEPETETTGNIPRITLKTMYGLYTKNSGYG